MFKKIGASIAGLFVVTGSAIAAVPAGVTNAIEGAGTDAIAVATAVLVVVVGLLAFRYMRREAK